MWASVSAASAHDKFNNARTRRTLIFLLENKSLMMCKSVTARVAIDLLCRASNCFMLSQFCALLNVVVQFHCHLGRYLFSKISTYLLR